MCSPYTLALRTPWSAAVSWPGGRRSLVSGAMAGEGDGPGERVELGEVYEQELVALPVAGDLSFGDPAAEGDAVAAGVGGGLGEGGGAAWPAWLRVDAPWWGTGM